MHIEFNDDHGVKRWRALHAPVKRLWFPKLGVTTKCICFLATPALVAAMLAANIPVRSHPLYPNQYVVPDKAISSITFRDLIANREFVFLATVVFLGSPTGSNQTYTSDATWNNSNNSVEVLAGGGSGGAAGGSSQDSSSGGGGSSYSKITNFTFATPGTTTATWQVGAGGAAVTRSTSGASVGNAGNASWFNASANPGNGSDNSQASASPGSGGASTTTGGGSNGGAGGLTTTCWGQTKNAGGRGGNTTQTPTGTGGGGAAGPAGAGGNGVDTASTTSSNGGIGNNGTDSGGTGQSSSSGTITGGNGTSGTEWPSGSGFVTVAGCGGGGGSAASTNNSAAGTCTGGTGGNYGGGGAGASAASLGSATSGAGAQGLIVLTWTPPVIPTKPGVGTRGTTQSSAFGFNAWPHRRLDNVAAGGRMWRRHF